MAVADAERSEKIAKAESRRLESAGVARERPRLVPRKIKEGRAFLSEVRAELKKVTWPSQKEVYSTTIVVIGTTVFFGFYLWLLDLGFSRALSHLLKG